MEKGKGAEQQPQGPQQLQGSLKAEFVVGEGERGPNSLQQKKKKKKGGCGRGSWRRGKENTGKVQVEMEGVGLRSLEDPLDDPRQRMQPSIICVFKNTPSGGSQPNEGSRLGNRVTADVGAAPETQVERREAPMVTLV